jgi:hypothetical protein
MIVNNTGTCVVIQCSLVQMYHPQGIRKSFTMYLEVVVTSEALIYIYQITLRRIIFSDLPPYSLVEIY